MQMLTPTIPACMLHAQAHPYLVQAEVQVRSRASVTRAASAGGSGERARHVLLVREQQERHQDGDQQETCGAARAALDAVR